MKQIFILLMVAMCAIMFAACSDDDDTTVNPDGKRLVSKICKEQTQAEEEDYYELNFQYDKNGIIEKVVEIGRESWDSHYDEWTDTYSFSRSGNKLTVKNDYTSTDETDKIEIKTYTTDYILNDKGYIFQYEWIDEEDGERRVYKYSYNDEGQLVGCTEEEHRGTSFNEYTYEYSWSNGNLVSGSSYVNYTYTNEENKANIDLGAFWGEADYDGSNYNYLELFGYLGSTNKNCLYKYSGSHDTYTYKYSFDTNGYVTKMKKYDRNSELLCTYTIEYK